jgi:ribosomal protein L24E
MNPTRFGALQGSNDYKPSKVFIKKKKKRVLQYSSKKDPAKLRWLKIQQSFDKEMV